jgi:hypothetical protein
VGRAFRTDTRKENVAMQYQPVPQSQCALEMTVNNIFAIFPLRLCKGLALVVAIALGLSCNARADDATTQPSSVQQDNAELRSEVNQLRTKVDQLEANQSAASQPGQQPPIVPNTNQSSFNAFRFTSGYDPAVGFVLRSDDNQFSLHPGFVFDFRNMTSYREKLVPNSGSEVPKPGYTTQNGFDVTRARLTFDGRATDYVTYFIQFQDDQGTSFGLLDAYWAYHFGKDSPFALKVGQFKDPIWHERNLSEATLLTVDRSLVEALIGGGQTGRVQGVDLMYDQERLRTQLVFHDGFNSINTKFFDAGGLGAGVTGGSGITPTNFGASGRAELMLIGDRTADFNPFTEYDRQFSALGDKQDILVLGGGADFTQASSNDALFHTADLQYDTTCGFSAYGAYLGTYRDIHVNQGVTKGFYYDPGFVFQLAYLVTPKIEPFARYDYTYLPLGSTTGLFTGEAQEVTVGANYYLYHQNLKLTLDASWLPNGSPVDSDALGILKDSGHGEFVVRAQFQLAI